MSVKEELLELLDTMCFHRDDDGRCQETYREGYQQPECSVANCPYLTDIIEIVRGYDDKDKGEYRYKSYRASQECQDFVWRITTLDKDEFGRPEIEWLRREVVRLKWSAWILSSPSFDEAMRHEKAPEFALWYAMDVIRERFARGEDAIRRDEECWRQYQEFLSTLKGRSGE